jgi:putative RecB family exonuclease
MPVYSHSRLATYENCPQQYKLRYIDKLELPDAAEGIEAFLGSRVHEALEKLHKELILSKQNSLEDLISYYKDIWQKNWNENVTVVKKGFTSDHYHQAGIDAIKSYYQRYQPFQQGKTLTTEMLISFKIDDFTFQGYIDRLSQNEQGVYEVHDYKTSGSLPAQQKFDEDRQLALYQIGIREKFTDAKDVKLIWHYLLFDKEFVSERTGDQLEDLKKEIVSLIKTIEKDTKFQPNESRLCDWCEYPQYCPARKHEYKVQDLPPNKYLKEKGVSLVNQYASIKSEMKLLSDQQNALQQELDLIEEAAIEYAKNENICRIAGSDCSLSVKASMVLDFPKAGDEKRPELEACLKKLGVWEQVSGLTLTRLAQLAKDENIYEKTRKQLMKYAQEIERMSVRLVKKRIEE